MLYYVFLFLALVLNATANILIKIGANKIGDLSGLSKFQLITGYFTNLYILGGMVIFALNIFFYMASLSKINLSIAYPIITSGGFLIISLVSVFVLKESLNAIQIAGIVLMSVGITMVSFKS